MIIFISGSINSGKTTTAKALAEKIGAEFIDIDDLNDRIPNFNLESDIPKGIAIAIDEINKLTQAGKSAVISYPIRREDYEQIKTGLIKDPLFITLAPRLEVAQSKRGDRELSEWEVARIKYHYETGIASPSFGRIIDTSDMTLDQVVQEIINGIKS